MIRYLTVLLLAAAVATIVGAQNHRPGPSPEIQARLLARNRHLLRATVGSSLELGEKTDHLERAGACNRLVKIWALEVERAAGDHELQRVVELGEHLNRVVERGIAGNLRIARGQIEVGSPMEMELLRRRDEALQVIHPLEATLDAAARNRSELSAIARAVADVRRRVEAATEK